MPQSQYRYVVFDNALQGTDLVDWAIDEFVDALRAPLAAIDVIVERKKCRGITIGIGEFLGAESLSSRAYIKKYDQVDRAVRRVLREKREKSLVQLRGNERVDDDPSR